MYDYEVINNKIKGVVIITKTDMKGKLLKGAEFTLYDREGNVISKEVSKEDGLVTFSNIDYGEYIIKETKAPKGYILGNKQLEIKVKSPETQNFTVKNESEKIIDKVLNVLPNTGNKFDPRAIIIVGVITALGGVYLFLRRSKIS
ncbi:Cna B domain-containing protein [Clostridium sartagoforme AAU1]|uniref:Cna B domain-containing protein n=1 Tax=Clostridium sartagoforme AAU1 TaxID=1202534 RepID=R9CHK3_9CLOT|nr:prealbumin-like fold domain-containing protein [Clostridium sartagoforme]EOR26681.1 Cna B domain-containing protein [Clostridium sartagoforme AAU1]